MQEAEIKKLKVADLKDKLGELGLSTAGKKDELVTRLVEHFHPVAADSPSKSKQSSTVASPATTLNSGKTVKSPVIQKPGAVESKSTGKSLPVLENELESPPEDEPDWMPKAKPTASSVKTTVAASSTVKAPVTGTAAKASAPVAISTTSASSKSSAATTPTTAVVTPRSPGSAVQISKEISEEEKRRLRMARFGLQVKDVKQTAATADGNSTVIKKPEVNAPAAVKAQVLVDPEVMKRRQERFGIVQPPAAQVNPAADSIPAAKKQKLDSSAVTAQPVKFGLSKEDEELRRKRLERFAGTAVTINNSNSSAMVSSESSAKAASK